MNDDSELERMRVEARELRGLVLELSAALRHVMAALPPDLALALARGEEADSKGPSLALEAWRETAETTRADFATEMALLWARLPPRESP